jgi:hypothetical protein
VMTTKIDITLSPRARREHLWMREMVRTRRIRATFLVGA